MAQEQQFAKVYEDGWDDTALDEADDARDAGASPAPAPIIASPPVVAAPIAPPCAPALAAPVPPAQPAAAPLPSATATMGPQATSPAAQPQLAQWPARDRVGLYPALFSRSALFQVGRGKRCEPPPTGARSVACQGEHQLSVVGPRLSMRDKAVWEFALDRARAAGQIGSEFEFPLRACVLWLGAKKERKSESLRRVRESLDGLAATTLRYELATGEKGSCKLLGGVRQGEKSWVVALDPDLGKLLAADFLFATNAARRRTLKCDLAKWLHDFHSTHEQFDGSFSPDTLRTLCGYEAQAGHFPSMLQSSLADVKELAPGLLAEFQVAKPTSVAKSWRVSVTRGEEVVKFEMPEREWRKRGGRRPNL